MTDLNNRSNDFVGVIDGGPGNDTLKGSSGRDRLDGGVGSDTLYGFDGDEGFALPTQDPRHAALLQDE